MSTYASDLVNLMWADEQSDDQSDEETSDMSDGDESE